MNGDRFSRAEFERRYHAMPNLRKAELIEGIVYVPSPVNHSKHGKQHLQLSGWLSHYLIAGPEHQAFADQLSRATALKAPEVGDPAR
jgi:hypothetical protein